MAGTIELRDNGIEVIKADDKALISLELLANHDERAMRVRGDLIHVGNVPADVVYRVVGWDHSAKALEIERVI